MTWPATDPVSSLVNPRAQHDYVGVSGRLQEFLDPEPADRGDRDRFRLGAVESRQDLVGFRLGSRASLLGPVRLNRIADHAAEVACHGLVHGEHGERRMADRRFFHGPFQCPEAGGWALGHKIDGTRAEYVRVPYADISTLPGSVRRKS